MIDLANEQVLWLADAVRCLPAGRDGRPVHVATIMRWILTGVRGVKLEAAKLGGRWVTSREAVQRFSDAQGGRHCPGPPSASERSPKARRKAKERASRELDRMGMQ